MAQPVATKARKLANKSATDRSVKMTTRQTAVIRLRAVTPCMNLKISWKFDFFELKVKICKTMPHNLNVNC